MHDQPGMDLFTITCLSEIHDEVIGPHETLLLISPLQNYLQNQNQVVLNNVISNQGVTSIHQDSLWGSLESLQRKIQSQQWQWKKQRIPGGLGMYRSLF